MSVVVDGEDDYRVSRPLRNERKKLAADLSSMGDSLNHVISQIHTTLSVDAGWSVCD